MIRWILSGFLLLSACSSSASSQGEPFEMDSGRTEDVPVEGLESGSEPDALVFSETGEPEADAGIPEPDSGMTADAAEEAGSGLGDSCNSRQSPACEDLQTYLDDEGAQLAAVCFESQCSFACDAQAQDGGFTWCVYRLEGSCVNGHCVLP